MLEGEARTFPVRVSRTDGACDSVQFLRHAATSLAGDKLRLGDERHPSRCVKAAAVKAVSGKCEMLSVGFFSARVTPTTPTRPPHGRGLTRLPPHQAHARQRIRHRASRALLTEGSVGIGQTLHALRVHSPKARQIVRHESGTGKSMLQVYVHGQGNVDVYLGHVDFF